MLTWRSATSPTRRKPLLLQHLEQPRLDLRVHVAHLVEEHGAPVGDLQQPRLAGHGARERASFVTEELGFEQLARQAGAVDVHERLFRAGPFRCSHRASTPFPVPVLPWMRIGLSARMTFWASSASRRMAALLPTKGSTSWRASRDLPAACRRCERCASRSRSRMTRSDGSSTGFVRKCSAPSLIARTARSMDP